jgi:AcrR family transcriptional regulator
MLLMSKPTRSVEQVDVVRDKILDCAFNNLAKNGYKSLLMAEIGSKMKMTASNLYNYYTNKDELLLAIHKKAYIMLYDKISYAVEMGDTPLEKYKSMVYAIVEFGTQHIAIYDMMFNIPVQQYTDYIGTPHEALLHDELHGSEKVLHFAIKVIWDYRETRSDIKPDDPKLLALQCFSALHGVISLHNSGVLFRISDDLETTMKTIIDSTMRLVIG